MMVVMIMAMLMLITMKVTIKMTFEMEKLKCKNESVFFFLLTTSMETKFEASWKRWMFSKSNTLKHESGIKICY